MNPIVLENTIFVSRYLDKSIHIMIPYLGQIVSLFHEIGPQAHTSMGLFIVEAVLASIMK